jgi:hypothetical protein
MLGIARLAELMERCGEKGLTNLSLEAIEELVVAASKKAKHRKQKDLIKKVEVTPEKPKS